LFCWHAFRGKKPPENLAESAEKAAIRCGGLPLALKVLGRQVLAAKEEDKKDVLETFVKLPQMSGAMDACRAIIVKSYNNLPDMHSDLRDVFILVAGVWPRTPEFMQRQRAAENVGAAVYGDEPRSTRFELASKALESLNKLSLVGLKEDGDAGGLSLTVHDLIVDVAETLAGSKEPGCEKFFRQPADAEGLGLPRNSSRLEHLSIHSGSISIGEVPAACSLLLGPGAELVGSLPSPCRLLGMENVKSVRLHELRNLRCLRLRQGLFNIFPEGIEKLRYLCILEVRDCMALRSLPKTVGVLTGLTSLDLSGCRALASLPESVGALSGLTSLDLSGCSALASLPESVGALSGLTSLDLSGCRALPSLPESVGALTGLMKPLTKRTTLSLSSLFGLDGTGALQSLPEWIGQLTGLTSLDLKYCWALQSVPESVGALTGLTGLGLRGCEALRSLPESVGRLTGLTSLDLNRCRALRSLPESVGQLTGLTSLNLEGCRALRSLPQSFGKLTGLARLSLGPNPLLKSLPEDVGALTGLTGLDLRECWALKSLPESVGALTGLTWLDLSWCSALASLPETVGRLTGLTSLVLRECWALRSLPESIRALKTLRFLDLRGCELLVGASRYWWAAAQDDLTAQCNLAWCYEQGRGVEKDEARATELYAKAAEQGNAAAQCNLGVYYFLGHGVEKNETRATELFAKAANQGLSSAQTNLGEMYAEGLGVVRDWAAAYRLFVSAAQDAENLSAKLMLAWLLWHGRGTEQDRPRAEGLCAEVSGTERFAERLANDYFAAGEIWPAVLK
jgi:Leucine-rich repeat (LRR) protein